VLFRQQKFCMWNFHSLERTGKVWPTGQIRLVSSVDLAAAAHQFYM